MPPPAGAPSFDLLDEPWIPYTETRGAATVGGIRQVLACAHEIREIADPSPVVTVALHRLLIAVIHAAYRGPGDADAWAGLRNAGRFSEGVLDTYLLPLRDRFDLFQPERPFYQDASLGEEYAAVISRLALELASGNNATLFDHTTDVDAPAIPPADAARLLVAQHAFGLGGRITFEKGQGQHGSAKAGLLVKAAVVLVTGRSLFETLLLNLHQYAPGEGIPCPTPVASEDCPAWERDDRPRPVDRPPRGYLDFLTWQSRRVRLIPEQAADGSLRVRRAVLMKGEQLPDGWHRRDAETMVAFTKNERAKGTEDPWPAVTFREDRALWRDSLALLTLDATHDRPRTLTWLDDLVRAHVLRRSDRLLVDAFGTVSDQAKMLMWRHERLTLPLAYLDQENRELLGQLRRVVADAEETAAALRAAIWRLATLLVAPGAADPDARQPAQATVRPVAEQFTPLRAFWPRLDLPFRDLLLALPTDKGEEDGDVTYGDRELPRWRETLRGAAREALDEATLGLDTSARTLRALAVAQAVLGGGLRKALGPAPRRQDPIPEEVA